MIEGVLFDKDGTLFDFQSTWAPPFQQVLDQIEDAEQRQRAAEALEFDTLASRFLPSSPAIAGTTSEVAQILAPHFDGDIGKAVALLNSVGTVAQQQPAVPLESCLGALAEHYTLGLVTNDGEASARAHLRQEAVHDLFTFVAGYDSGFGAKPGPGQLLAFVDATGIAPTAAVMVGDSRHDLAAGRAAGMRTVGVLTGVAGADELDDLADVVLPDIGHLADWIAQI